MPKIPGDMAAFLMRRAWLAAAFAACVLPGCHRAGEPAKARAILRVSERNEPSDLDPATASLPDDFFVIRALSEGLAFPPMPGDPALRSPTPAAAESWTRSPDGRVWTFRLRNGALWSNGDPVLAADFVASYERVLAPATASPRAELLFPVRNARAYNSGRLRDFTAVGFRALDARTLRIELEHPLPDLPAYAASGPWIPVNPRVVARWGRDWTRPEHAVGNGPFVLAEWSPHRRITVRRNPRYRDAAHVRVDEIQFVRVDDGETEDRAYRAGQIDVTMAVPVDRIAGYEHERPGELHRQLLAEVRYLSFNTTRPPFDRTPVRRALSLAIDRAALVRDVLRGAGLPVDRFTGADPACASRREEARRLLAAAGFPGGRGFPRFELAAWGGNSGQRVAEAVQRMWSEELGVAASLTIREARVHVAAVQAGNYDIALLPLIPWVSDPAAALQEFRSGSGPNYPHWSDPAFDRALAAAENAGEPLSRQHELDLAAQILAAETPAAPLYRNLHVWLMRPQVREWHENGIWERFYPRLWLDPGTGAP